MNIIAVKPDGTFCFRPDSTLNHQFADYYRPDAVTALEVVPVVYTRLTKAGKCVAERFARRYFDSFAFGCLINDRTDSTADAMRFSMDQTSVMGMDFHPIEELPACKMVFEINGEALYTGEPPVDESLFATAIAAITSRSMLRLGDIVALEVTPPFTIEPGDTVALEANGNRHEIKIL